ncbi:MAG: filamentous hemagglutinin N-terminal domain-containing protein, partial [Geminicoccaceae bacterium]|nr:filamentous hemagglutinin N-terminal domain-containing protein [Geminicoccaceae bacterium]
FSGDFEIPAAVGRLEGPNLFHSFDTFHVRTGESATFTGPSGIDNLISRVTGGAVSEIDGLLASTVPGADFFFLNPAGVLFGPNASLSVPGAFHVSTADELRFADGTAFDAGSPGASSFTMAPPESFGFLGNDGGITVDRASFGTAFGQTLSLSGSSVSIDGGNAGVASGGSAGFVFATDGPLQVAAIRSGSLDLATGAVVTDQAGPVRIDGEATLQVVTAGQGAIRISGGELTIEERAAVQIFNVGAADDPNGVELSADRILIGSESSVATTALADGTGGPIRIATSELLVDGGSIESNTLAAGDGGQITVAADRLDVRGGRGILATSGSGSTGDAGDIEIRAGSVVVDSAVIDLTRLGSGAAGQLFIQATDVTLSGAAFGIQAPNPTSGSGGRVEVVADRLTVDGAALSTSTIGDGPGGDIVLDLGELVVSGGGQISAATLGPGEAGDITIQVDEARVVGLGTAITVFSTPSGPGGDAGDIVIDAGELRLVDGGAISSETSGNGAAGSVSISVEQGLVLSDSGQIRASSTGTGRPGDITIDVGRLELVRGGSISSPSIAEVEGADTASSTIRITARERIRIEGTPERLSGVTSATLGPRDAGTIRIDSPMVELVENATLSSSTLGEGDAGAVRLVVDDLTIGPNSSIDSASPNFDRPNLP